MTHQASGTLMSKHLRPLNRLAACAAILGLASLPALAVEAAPERTVHLTTQAQAELPQDWMQVVLFVQREGAEAGVVQRQLRDVLDEALATAKKQVQGDDFRVETGTFGLSPRYDNKGQPKGWQGQAELVLQGRDAAALGQMVTRLNKMSVSRVMWSLSPQAREAKEGELTQEAIKKFRSRAQEVAQAFGATGYTLREVRVQSVRGGEMPVPVMRSMAMADGVAAAPPPEPGLPSLGGKSQVQVTVSGSVQLKP